MIYLTAIGFTPGGSSTVHIYTQTIHRQHNRHKQYTEQHNSLIRKSADRTPSLRGIPWHLPYNWGKSTENRQAECFKSIVHITYHKSTVGHFIGWDVNKFCCYNLICLLPSCHLTLRLLMSYIYIYIYGAPILDVSRSHTTTHHSR